MAGFFVRLAVLDKLAAKGMKRFIIGEKSTGEVLFSGAVKEQKPGRKGESVPAKSWSTARRINWRPRELLAAVRTATGSDAAGLKMDDATVSYFLRYFGTPTNGRGEFQGSLAEHLFLNNSRTKINVIQICEYLPKMAEQIDKLAVVRSMRTQSPDHPDGIYPMHTCYKMSEWRPVWLTPEGSKPLHSLLV